MSTILGPDKVDPSKLSPREYKAQKKLATDLYNDFFHEALRDLAHKGNIVPEYLSTEVSYNE